MGTICYSITDSELPYCHFMASTRVKTAVEIRLDGCNLDGNDIREVFSVRRDCTLIATYHVDGAGDVPRALELLGDAIMAGTDYVDIPCNLPDESRKWLISLALNKGCRIIISYHNYHGTDPLEKLLEIGRKAFGEGADIVKIVTTAGSRSDAATVLKLYSHFTPSSLIAFAMGLKGVNSRFLSFQAGAPFFYVSPCRNSRTAGGQPCYFNFLPGKEVLLKGSVDIPSSKSFAQRAIVLSALAEGTTKLYGYTSCQDTSAAVGVAESLGADINLDGDVLTITGHQHILRDGLKIKDNLLSVGESGLLARLCIPLAGLAGEDITITGEGTLLRRKVGDYKQALKGFGLKVDYTDRFYLPAVVRGKLHPSDQHINGGKGSQMISGLLLALSQCNGTSTICIDNLTSVPYMDLTTYVASFFGLDGYSMESRPDEENELERVYTIEGPSEISPVIGVQVEKDWSAAAMMMVAAAMMGNLTFPGLDIFSNQADAEILDILKTMHVDITERGSSPRVINVRKSILMPFYHDITDTPDLFAPLFLLAVRAAGVSVISGIKRLSNKESNRAESFASQFRKIGVRISTHGDEMHIFGHEHARFPGGVSVSSFGDHRLAMALSIVSLICDQPLEIDDTDCVSKSYPGFYAQLDKLKCNE